MVDFLGLRWIPITTTRTVNHAMIRNGGGDLARMVRQLPPSAYRNRYVDEELRVTNINARSAWRYGRISPARLIADGQDRRTFQGRAVDFGQDHRIDGIVSFPVDPVHPVRKTRADEALENLAPSCFGQLQSASQQSRLAKPFVAAMRHATTPCNGARHGAIGR